LGEGEGFEIGRPDPAVPSGKMRTVLTRLVRRLRRKMHSPSPLECNKSPPLSSPEQKHRQNQRQFGSLALRKYGDRKSAGGGRETRNKLAPLALRSSRLATWRHQPSPIDTLPEIAAVQESFSGQTFCLGPNFQAGPPDRPPLASEDDGHPVLKPHVGPPRQP
jgi:hypothetical protein